MGNEGIESGLFPFKHGVSPTLAGETDLSTDAVFPPTRVQFHLGSCRLCDDLKTPAAPKAGDLFIEALMCQFDLLRHAGDIIVDGEGRSRKGEAIIAFQREGERVSGWRGS